MLSQKPGQWKTLIPLCCQAMDSSHPSTLPRWCTCLKHSYKRRKSPSQRLQIAGNSTLTWLRKHELRRQLHRTQPLRKKTKTIVTKTIIMLAQQATISQSSSSTSKRWAKCRSLSNRIHKTTQSSLLNSSVRADPPCYSSIRSPSLGMQSMLPLLNDEQRLSNLTTFFPNDY